MNADVIVGVTEQNNNTHFQNVYFPNVGKFAPVLN
jgi:hypothetical protein